MMSEITRNENDTIFINSKVPIYFDIETTGLSGVNDEFVLAVAAFPDRLVTAESLEELNELSEELNGILVGYNTSGFDFPFLRMNYLKQGKEWPFKGITHLDIADITKYELNTKAKVIRPPSYSGLSADDVKDLAWENSMNYDTKKKTYKILKESHLDGQDINWMGRQREKLEENGSLQDLYQLFFDPEAEEEYISGEKIPELYEAGRIEDIRKHCMNDVVRLQKVTEYMIDVFTTRTIDRASEVL